MPEAKCRMAAKRAATLTRLVSACSDRVKLMSRHKHLQFTVKELFEFLADSILHLMLLLLEACNIGVRFDVPLQACKANR